MGCRSHRRAALQLAPTRGEAKSPVVSPQHAAVDLTEHEEGEDDKPSVNNLPHIEKPMHGSCTASMGSGSIEEDAEHRADSRLKSFKKGCVSTEAAAARADAAHVTGNANRQAVLAAKRMAAESHMVDPASEGNIPAPQTFPLSEDGDSGDETIRAAKKLLRTNVGGDLEGSLFHEGVRQ